MPKDRNEEWEKINRLNKWEIIVAQEQQRRKEPIKKIDLSERSNFELRKLFN